MENFIPTKKEFFTRDWFLMVLNHYRDVKQLSLLRSPDDITALDIRQLPGSGEYSSSYLASLQFKCFTSMGPEQFRHELYIKAAPEAGGAQLEAAAEARTMEREVEVYLRLVPRIKMSLDTGPQHSALPISEIIYGAYQDTGEGILVALDLAKDGYLPLDVAEEVSLGRLVKVMETLGRFHATSAAHLGKVGRAQLETEFPRLAVSVYNTNAVWQQVNRDLQEFSQLIRRVPGFYEQYLQFEEWRRDAWDILSSADREDMLKCIIHGNLSSEDVMMSDADTMVFTSMSRCHVGTPAEDISTFLLSSCDKETRLQNITQLLESYYFSFSEQLKRLGVDQDSAFPSLSLKTLKADYEKCLFSAFIKSSLISMRKIKRLQEEFQQNESSATGEKLRVVSGRALELVDEVFLSEWRQKTSSCQVESSSFTLKIPSQIPA